MEFDLVKADVKVVREGLSSLSDEVLLIIYQKKVKELNGHV